METNIAFCGAGFLGIYHIGVVSCLKAHAQKLLDNINKYGGCSAGALAACMLLCDINMEACVQFVMNQASKVHQSLLGPMSRNFDICTHIRKSCAKHLPADAYERASGKLFVSLTRARDLQNVIVSQYNSNDDLIDALICTCFVPVFCGVIPPKFQGVAYFDGGLTNNLPQHFEGTTITVSPFGGENDICPNDRHQSSGQFDMRNTNMQFSCHNLYRMSRAMFPPDNEVLTRMCQQGFNDALKYLNKTYHDYLNLDIALQFPLAECLDLDPKRDQDDVTDGIQDGAASGVESDSAAYISEAEQIIITEKALRNIISPVELNEILRKTKETLDSEKLNWYFLQMFITMSDWTRKPCKYTSTYVLDFSKRMLAGLLPKIQWVGSKNDYTQRLIDLVTKGFHAYKETTHFEWHPTIKAEDQINIQFSRDRLKSLGDALKIVPKAISPKPSRKKVTFHDDPQYSGYQTDIEDTHDDNDLDDGQEHVVGVTSILDTEADDDLDQDFLYFSTPVLKRSQENLMSIEEDLVVFENEADQSAESASSSLTDSLKDVVARGVGYIFTKSLGLD
ncbi:uncharacterized protein [Clytia hemisphaerica]|uniref:triacylglycerol lipase n=1 Tax=Clytia hemisphaerica TaxID=252671 RepID=A0A7M5UBT1_9CNID